MKSKKITSGLKYLLLSCCFVVSSCEEKTPKTQYEGENFILLKTEKSNFNATKDANGEVTIEVLLTNSIKEDLTLNFALEPETESCKLESSEITIPAQQNKGLLKLYATGTPLEKEQLAIKVVLQKSSAKDIKLKSPLNLTLIADPDVPVLTAEQTALLEGYKKDPKKAKILSLLGKKNVTGKVLYKGAEGWVSPFEKDGVFEIKGNTIITLSENCDKNNLIFKMIHNAMGLNAFAYEIFKARTINNEFWKNDSDDGQPCAKLMRKLAKLTENETFVVELDHLKYNSEKNEINFLKEEKDSYDSDILVVPFAFQYSAWHRILQLKKQKNADIIAFEKELGGEATISAQEGTLNPNFYFNRSTIAEDDWGKGYYLKPEFKYDTTNNIVTFLFCMDIDEHIDYMKFEINIEL